MILRTPYAKILLFKRSDPGRPIDLSRFLMRVQTKKSLSADSIGLWSIGLKKMSWMNRKTFSILDFIAVFIDDGRSWKPNLRLVTAGPLTSSTGQSIFSDSPRSYFYINGADSAYYLQKSDVFFHQFIASEALRPIVDLLLLPLSGSADEIATAWWRIRTEPYRDTKIPNGLNFQDWLAFYNESAPEGVVTTEPVLSLPSIDKEYQAASVATRVQGQSSSRPWLEFDQRSIKVGGQSGTEYNQLGRTLAAFIGDFPSLSIVGSGIASEEGTILSVLESVSDPVRNEFFIDTFEPSLDDSGQLLGPPRAFIVMRPRPFWTIVDEDYHGVAGARWEALKSSRDFGVVRVDERDMLEESLGFRDDETFTYWLARSSFSGPGNISWNELVVNYIGREEIKPFGRDITLPIFEKRKAIDWGFGVRRFSASSDYLQIKDLSDEQSLVNGGIGLTLKLWDWYFANHEFQSGTIRTALNTSFRIGRPIALYDMEGYTENVEHVMDYGDSPKGSTSVSVSRMINQDDFLALEADRFAPGYLDNRITQRLVDTLPAPFNKGEGRVDAAQL